MKAFKDFFKDEDIILYLCKIRAKNAKSRNKKHLIHLLTKNEKYNYHKPNFDTLSEYERQFQDDLNKLFPSRKKWKNLGKESRYKKESKQKLTSVDKNIYSLLKTIRYYIKKEPNEPFVVNLKNFILEIQNSIQDINFSILSPTIYPKTKDKKTKDELKEDEKNTCRPISLFSLKDRIILSFTNRYLTQLFDGYFNDCSLAFRAVRRKIDGNKEIISHHSAIQEIITYKNTYPTTPLWVAECDMKKFYDSVNHSIIIQYFDTFLGKVKNENQHLDFSIPQRIFYKYLECYCFNKDVTPLNDDIFYWKKHNVEKGVFGWINQESNFNKYYSDISNERIGIPQGGALSGLIANLVLDYADNAVIGKSNIFYVRFCDDMILMHPDKTECENSISIYKEALEKLKLFPHEFCEQDKLKEIRDEPVEKLPRITLAPFWKEKSKKPFKWDSFNDDGFPWIGFVGYEIHFKGYIRVRKSSVEKELKKQYKVVLQIENAIKDNRRASNGTISESAIHRLIGMSVGRVELWNWSEVENDMCWKKGFQELNNNKYSIKQLKQLDRTRNKLYYRLVKDLKEFEEEKIEDAVILQPRSRQIIAYNKPFSYYYHIVKK
jgi:hypothetical protein